jgi:hypothetical protein
LVEQASQISSRSGISGMVNITPLLAGDAERSVPRSDCRSAG